ncbi:unnamed protein product [Rotaria sp. Silwood1]|nr:unnamed protein product [Rotaria sp. Silwood1]CAF1426637.1 unnamed protein product [Rotaria sp. Silwood1]CAF3548767.1 unnamed protein product [Rotaria sp. Silwood1]CAF3581624.1 unnamed protein product [Rotaria sp. Silwood1]CAF4620579.1 unnamed protein product [Rotaria sp. Silwood1]
MSTITGNIKSMTSSLDANELILEIPVWVNGKRKWVTGITKKTTFDDLIYALLVQAELLKSSDITNSSSNNIAGYAIAECIQSTSSSTESVITQRIFKGRSKVIKAYKTWHFDKLPFTILHLISTSSVTDNNNNNNHSSTTKFRSKLFRRFLSSKETHHEEFIHQKLLNNYQENLNILERQKRLLNYLDEQIHQIEKSSSNINTIVNLNDVSHLLSSKPIKQEQLILATQLCNSIFNIQEHIDEKTNILYAVEQAISNELNHVLHQQHYDTLPLNIIDNTNSSNDLLTLKNSIYRSRELSRIQSKEMHDLDLSLREAEILIGSKYDELKYLEYETSSNSIIRSRSLTPSINLTQKLTIDEQRQQQQTSYDTLELAFNSMKEVDEDSGINSLTSEDSNHHSMSMIHQKMNTQLETLV